MIHRVTFLVILAALGNAKGARILAFFPFQATSHHIATQPVVRALAERGHQVDFYTGVSMSNPPKTLTEILLKLQSAQQTRDQFDPRQFGNAPAPLVSYALYQIGETFNENVYSQPEIIELINSDKKYDLVIGEFLFVNENGVALGHKFNAPTIAIQPLGECAWVNELSGLPDNPSYMIDYKSLYTDRMSFFQRLHNTYTTLVTNLISYYYVTFPYQTQMDKHFNYKGWETRPRLPQLVSDLALILINSHHSAGYSYPKAPHVKEVGGLNIQTSNKPLPQELQTFMDSAQHGVIYFSMGSVLDMRVFMEDGALEAFLKVFSGLKQKVLWKWTRGVDFPNINNPNIKFSTWFPQQDVLAHKNVRAFITHGGLMSSFEAVNYGVPIVGMAVFGDQPKNIKRMVSAGYGVELSYNNLTDRAVSWALNEILNNPSYKAEVLKRQALFKDRPMKPAEEAVYWIEYVLRHGKALQPASVHMPFCHLYMLDILGVICGSIFVVFYITKKILCGLCSLLKFRNSKAKSINQQKKKQ